MDTGFGGQLRVVLNVFDGCVSGVKIISTRPEDASHVFIGRRPGDVVSTVGLLFSLCGTAQTIASLQAVEQALGLTIPPQQSAARDVLRLAEMLSQTVLRLCVDWRLIFGLDVQPDLVRACLNAENQLEDVLFNATTWKVPGGVAVGSNLTKVQSILETVQTATTTFNDGPADQLRKALEALDIKDLGPDLATRLEDRLANLTHLPTKMLDCQKQLGQVKGVEVPIKPNGQGEATVETVRGPLTHKVTIEKGLILNYQIQAPTDVNFAEDGPLVQGLIGQDSLDLNTLKKISELYVLAIDPCVACTVEIPNA